MNRSQTETNPTPRRPAANFIVSGALVVILSVMAANPAQAKSQTIALDYDIFGRGIKLMTLKLNLVLNGNKYLATSKLETTGLADLFISIKARYEAAGTVTKTRISPTRFLMSIAKKKGKKTAIVSWKPDGRHKVRQIPPLSIRKQADVQRALRPGLPDPLSAMLALLLTNTDKPCRISHRVFDGRKIFDLTFSYVETTRVNGDESEFYQGKAYRCLMQDRAIAGYSRKKMKRMKNNPPGPLSILLAPVTTENVKRTFLIPIQISGKADWFTISVRLKNAKIDGKPFKTFSLARN